MNPDPFDSAPEAEPIPDATIDWTAPPVSWNGDLTPEVERIIDMSKV